MFYKKLYWECNIYFKIEVQHLLSENWKSEFQNVKKTVSFTKWNTIEFIENEIIT
jgi:hypothetical protein